MNVHYVKMRNQSGFTMIEVLVAVVILAIGLIGLAGMQSSALAYNKDALQRSQASAIVAGVMDAMRANRIQARANAYEVEGLPADDSASGGSTIVDRDKEMWQRRMFSELGQSAELFICQSERDGECGSGQFMAIRLEWADRMDNSGGVTQQIAFVGRL